jgi:NOL1/NOP2/fmu family ribosome biogenesis protein
MNIRFIKTPEKRRIIEELNAQFGISELPFLLIETGKEKVRGFTGHLSKEEIMQIGKLAPVEGIGAYLLRKEGVEWRLSFDALHLLKEQITKNIFEINEQQLNEWIRGNDLDIQAPAGILVISYKGDFIGSAKSTGTKLLNYVPKERRLRSKLPL